MSAPVDVLAVLRPIEVAVVINLDAIRGRMLAEGAEDDSDDEIGRCLKDCVCGARLIPIAKYARDCGLPLSSDASVLALRFNEDRALQRTDSNGSRSLAADALDAFSAALDERGAEVRNLGKREGAVAPHHESAQTMAHGSSAGGVSTQLPLFAALRACGGA